MTSSDWWLLGLCLRGATLLAVELGCFLFVVPTLFNLHSDAATAAAALVAVAGLAGGAITVMALSREVAAMLEDKQ